jgi:hypothetical protein
VFDLWVQAWRQKRARGDVIVVRFADDIVAGFQVKADAERFWVELAELLLPPVLRFHVGRLWHRTLSRRSQTGRVTWDRMRRLIDR